MRLKALREHWACASMISGKGHPSCTICLRSRSFAVSRFGWPASKTLEVAQELYDGQGKKIITYPRAEVRYLPESLNIGRSEDRGRPAGRQIVQHNPRGLRRRSSVGGRAAPSTTRGWRAPVITPSFRTSTRSTT